jgi:hypothetical protein
MLMTRNFQVFHVYMQVQLPGNLGSCMLFCNDLTELEDLLVSFPIV